MCYFIDKFLHATFRVVHRISFNVSVSGKQTFYTDRMTSSEGVCERSEVRGEDVSGGVGVGARVEGNPLLFTFTFLSLPLIYSTLWIASHAGAV